MKENIEAYLKDIKENGKATRSHDIAKSEIKQKVINIMLNEWACNFPRQTTAYEIKELGAKLIENYKKLKYEKG